ncbi:PDZ domain-containing protein [Alkalibacterium subtropicum]|uniref:endopeptidase La n=1 Tax=Alkalibacterium subtropicum TaxID=753702 RepID=A0A1I1EI32_9LACT|nr:SepM family pheromone-processing serine protease [Alkalibacterium subtropicum]SFB86711.1 PDZ domain-containing protein [Alkalibacterium subtropicum]
MNKKSLVLKTLLLGLAVYLLFFLPVPYFIERPGSAVVINDKVEVNGQTDDSESEYMLTTIEVFRATPFSALFQFLPYHSVVSEADLLGSYENYDDYRMLQQYYMDYSIDTAKAAAFNAADLPYEIEYEGVYVMSVSPESNFYGKLEMGDSISEINGESFENTDEFINKVSRQSVGDQMTLTVVSDGETSEVSGDLILIEETGNPGIGITLVTQSSVTTSPEVSIDAGNIGGPSAGLMFSLQVYKMLVEDFDSDLVVAGTGTIAENGDVGRIGGVDKKVVAAHEEGAEIFFAPEDEIDSQILEDFPDLQSNYETALEAAEDINTDMQIVPVDHISDAIDYLNNID